MNMLAPRPREETIHILASGVQLNGTLTVPSDALEVVLFAHVSGNKRFSPHILAAARALQDAGFATLVLDLVIHREEAVDSLAERITLLTPPTRPELAAMSVRRRVELELVPPERQAPILCEYARIAPSGRQHFPVSFGTPLSLFEAIAERHPEYRIEPV
jgi:hypothetical protein